MLAKLNLQIYVTLNILQVKWLNLWKKHPIGKEVNRQNNDIGREGGLRLIGTQTCKNKNKKKQIIIHLKIKRKNKTTNQMIKIARVKIRTNDNFNSQTV